MSTAEFAAPSLTAFFQEAVSTAMKNQGIPCSPDTEFYLVHLLSGYAHSVPPDDQPIALALAEARFASPDERAHQLRDVGDRSLYLSGFFAESLSRKLVDVDYYIEVGGGAYRQLAELPAARREPGVTTPTIFSELGTRFDRFVDVLAEVSEWSATHSDAGVLMLYERWLKTGAKWIERRLRARGMLPRPRETQ